MVVQEIATRTATFWLGNDGILRITLLGIEESLDDAQRTLATVVTLASGTPRPTLADIRTLRSLTRDVRNYYIASEALHMVSAAALFVSSPLSRMIGNVFAAIFAKGGIPLRLFTSEEDALAWLKGFVK